MFNLKNEIDSTREKLMRLLTQRNNPLDQDVILLSTKLDKLICRYYRVKAIASMSYPSLRTGSME